ncbi:TetR/AcrR family transcriptional regulator [Paenibacillus senegalensis]|uniref:TetR/AcrR family transcriptional regulator n=1 Tax=Paenibacillus senegalensis TaxID=1465766 RepID=UPI00031FDA1D|nr:TetR/AcrR family transcriptional regulator [Paenibacillus senegalensis]
MSERFEALEKEKRRRILDAAYREFAENGFEKASTNRIVKEAGISKGTLFYYFDNKETLFHYLIEHAIGVSGEQFLYRIDASEPDIFERFKQAGALKWNLYNDHESLSQFLAAVGLNMDELDLPDSLRHKLEELHSHWYRVLNDNIDYSKFREDVDVRKAFQLIRWSMEGYRQELMQKYKNKNLAELDVEPIYEEFYEYLDILKSCFYKEGEA